MTMLTLYLLSKNDLIENSPTQRSTWYALGGNGMSTRPIHLDDGTAHPLLVARTLCSSDGRSAGGAE